MPPLSFEEVSAASRNAMLSAKVSKMVRRARKGEALDARELEIAARGSDLLSKVVQGSLLVERKPPEQGCHADLKAYRHALSALAQLQREIKQGDTQAVKDVTVAFKGYRENLNSLAQGKKVTPLHLDRLAEFFRLLSDYFFRDVQAPPPIRKEQIQSLAA